MNVVITCGCGPEDRCPNGNGKPPCAMHIPELDLLRITNDVVRARFEATQREEEKMKSTGDDRVVNNVMRHNYRVLSDQEKEMMQRVKDKGLEFLALLHEVGGTMTEEEFLAHDGPPVNYASRELSIAATNAEQAVMWAVKHITR